MIAAIRQHRMDGHPQAEREALAERLLAVRPMSDPTGITEQRQISLVVTGAHTVLAMTRENQRCRYRAVVGEWPVERRGRAACAGTLGTSPGSTPPMAEGPAGAAPPPVHAARRGHPDHRREWGRGGYAAGATLRPSATSRRTAGAAPVPSVPAPQPLPVRRVLRAVLSYLPQTGLPSRFIECLASLASSSRSFGGATGSRRKARPAPRSRRRPPGRSSCPGVAAGQGDCWNTA
jgi:hypothetical protein